MSAPPASAELATVLPLATRFGLVTALLAVVSPYFLGLATSVAAFATVAWIPQWLAILRGRSAPPARRIGSAALLAAVVALGWCFGVGLVPSPAPAPGVAFTAVVAVIALAPRRGPTPGARVP
ncbi:MAG TPA: hypothetical protein VFF67_00680 [Thermoplasmata archaeon]|nr:hypothetical protein [Thermoplasmata archaeon]